MPYVLLWIVLVLAVVGIWLSFRLLDRVTHSGNDAGAVRNELRAAREEAGQAARSLREEVASSLGQGLTNIQNAQLSQGQRLEEALDRIRTTLGTTVQNLQESNEAKLEQMRKTVDEKLHETLEKRLNESFQQVSERLERVHQGLGEMQSLALGVGDLKRVLSNVKVRGTWAEVQVGSILEQILAPEQYSRNVEVVPGSGERVDYAVRLPGPKDDLTACVWLPIDSKFPQEDYARLQDAAERGDAPGVEAAGDGLNRRVRGEAGSIGAKYLHPPDTTDFALMYLATEGLYSEVLRQPTLMGELQRCRVIPAGPSTMAAILNSLSMGFQTLAIGKRATEVWRVLGAVKTEFGKFGQVLDKVKRQLEAASNTIDDSGRRSRAIERQLRVVEALPEMEANEVLRLGEAPGDEEP